MLGLVRAGEEFVSCLFVLPGKSSNLRNKEKIEGEVDKRQTIYTRRTDRFLIPRVLPGLEERKPAPKKENSGHCLETPKKDSLWNRETAIAIIILFVPYNCISSAQMVSDEQLIVLMI